MLRNAAARGFLLAAALLAAAPARAVDCTPGNTYAVPGTYGTITAALAAVPQTWPGPICVTINDSGVYNEQVTVRNFNTGGSSLTIQAAPGFFPAVNPPPASNAAFQLFNDSVNVQGITAQIVTGMPYGVIVSSSFVSLSSVTVAGGGNVTAAGVAMSSRTTLANSFVDAAAARAVLITGTGNVVVQTTMTANNGAFPALHLNGASTNTITSSFIHNGNGTAAILFSGGYNLISQSTISSPSPAVLDKALYLFGSSSNTISQTVISRLAAGAPKAVLIEESSNGNAIVGSSIEAGGIALTFSVTSSNTVVGSFVSGESAVVIVASTGTRISGTSMNAAASSTGLRFTAGSVGLTVSFSTVTTVEGANGVYSDTSNGGLIEIVDSFVSGAKCSICIYDLTPGSTVRIASNTIVPGMNASGSKGIDLASLTNGATIQNNSIYFRTGPGTPGMPYRGMVFTSSPGLLIERNRINQPGTLGTGSFTGVVFNSILNSSFHFNDIHSSGTMNSASYMIDMTASTVSIRNNVFLSSMTGGGSTFVRADGNCGLPLDYNTYYSSNSLVQLEWNGLPYQFPWPASVGADRHSINGSPQWANTAGGSEDFHPKSTIGRFNPATQLFVVDTVDSPTLDYADPAEPFAFEPSPNGGAANSGSYGNTIEASKSPASQCAVTRKVCKTGFCPFQTIQSAIDFLDNPLTAHSCIQFEDAAVYREYVRVEGFVNNGSSITIRLDPALTARPYVIPDFGGGTAVFTIRNSSVNITNVNVSAEFVNPTYGILASSANVNITSVTIADLNGRFQVGGIYLSSFSTLSYSSVVVQNMNAHGLRIDGQFNSVWFTTMSANASNGAALYVNNADSNTVTRSFMSNAGGHGVHLLNGADGNAISFSTMTSDANFYSGLYVVGSDTNSFINSYLANANGAGAVFNTGADYNTVSQSTMIARQINNNAALEIHFSSWNSVAQSRMYNELGQAAYLNNASWNTISQSTVVGTFNNAPFEGAAMKLFTSSHNTITSTYVQGHLGYGLFMDSGSNANTVAGSTVVAANTSTAFYVRNSSSNSFTAGRVTGGAGAGRAAHLDGSNYNAISLSTMTASDLAFAALDLFNAGNNVASGLYISNAAGTAVTMAQGSNFNAISLSTMAGGAASRYALEMSISNNNSVTQSVLTNALGHGLRVASSNDTLIRDSVMSANSAGHYALNLNSASTTTVSRSFINNPLGIAAYLEVSGAYNSISQSTITSAAANESALHLSGMSTVTVSFSYIQGSTAALVSGSSSTVINMSSLVATAAGGTALAVQSGGAGITVASSTLRGGATGRGFRLDPDYGGVVSIGSVTISGAARGIELSTGMGNFAVTVDSVNFRGLSAGATAIHFLGGLFSSTFTLANFEDTNIGANVSAAALGTTPASIIRMFGHYGARTGPSFENDPSNLVHWQAGNYAGCAVTANVGLSQTYATVTAALDGLKAGSNPLTGHTCVILRDGGIFAEQIIVEGFVNNGSSLTIRGDAALASRPTNRLGFVIYNASVNVVGIDLTPSIGLNTGIFISSPNVSVTSVNINDSFGNYSIAGITLSSWTTVSYTSVTVGGAYGFHLPGSVGSSISFSSAASNSFSRPAVYLDGASSNTFASVLARNAGSAGGMTIDRGGYNAVSLSSVSANGHGIYLSFSTGNSISGTYMGGDSNHALRLENTVLNTITQSTAVNSGFGAFAGLYLSGASTNTITGLMASGLNGYGGVVGNSSINNTISFSTFNGNSFGQYGLYLSNNASSNTISSSYVSNPAGTALRLETSSNTLNGVTITGSVSNYGLELSNALNNRMTIDALTGARIDNASHNNVITGSTLTKNDNTMHALYFQSGSSNTVTQSRLTNPLGYAMMINGGAFSNYMTVSQSTLATVSGTGAMFMGGTGHSLSSNYISNGTGYALEAQNLTYSSIQLSTITNNSAGSAALYMSNAATNTVSQSVIVNGTGNGVFLENNASWNSFQRSEVRGGASGIKAQFLSGLNIGFSTVTGGSGIGPGNAGVWANTGIEYITISQSYVQGSTAVHLSGSSWTVVNANVLVGGGGSGLYMTGGGTTLSMSSNTVLGGAAAGIAIDQVGGLITLSTNTVIARTGPYAIGLAATYSGASVWITSNTILPSLSASATTYGVYLDTLGGGATVQNNGIYYRTAGPALNSVGAGNYGLYANNVAGLRVDHNRISNPGMVTSGNFIGAAISQSPNAVFKFNDLHSTGAGLTTFHLLRVTNAAGVVVRNNILLSSMTATNNRMIVVDANSQAGFSSDYNTFFSSNAAYSAIWGTGGVSLLTNWVTTTGGRDANSLNANPLWLNATGEDFHPLSRGGRYTAGGDVIDAVSGPGLDRGDPAESIVSEPTPNLARANQGSYGQTAEASKSVLPCPLTVFVRQAGDGDETTIQDAINGLPNPLTAHSCVVIGDSGIYNEQVTVQGFTNVGNSSMTIMMEPSLTVHPTVRQGFVIRNASVSVTNIDVAPTAVAIAHGFFASSANVNITNAVVSDPGGFITAAGIAVSSFSAISNASVTVQGAHGIRLDGNFASVSNSSATANSAVFNALYFGGADTNTVTGGVFSNFLGGAGTLGAGSNNNTISFSTFTTPALGAVALDYVAAAQNTLTGSYAQSAAGYAVVLNAGSNYNTISLSTMASAIAANSALYLVNADSNTVTNSFMQNPAGTALYLDAGSEYNAISASTMAGSGAGTAALFMSGASFNTITGAAMSNTAAGYAVRLIGSSQSNAISFSTAANNNGSFAAVELTASSSNTFASSLLSNPAGAAASFTGAANYNTIANSTVAGGGVGTTLAFFAADFNTVYRSRVDSPAGGAISVSGSSDFTSISFSTVVSVNLTSPAIFIAGGSSNSVSNSYVQGSTAALVIGSTGTMINANVLVATNTVGSGFALQGGARGVSMSSNTIFGGTQGWGVFVDRDGTGTITLSTNTIHGGRYAVYLSTQQAGTAVWITSNTILPRVSNSFISYGLYLNGLVSGATIQNNGIYYRTPSATSIFYTAAIDARSGDGLVIANNRISNPGMITGQALGVGLTGVVNTVFKYNDVHSTGTAIASAYHMRLEGSPGTQLRNNVFSSSWSVTGSTAALYVDAGSQLGYVSDYNDFFSSNSFNSIEWGAASLPFPWTATTGTDQKSLAYHPRWKDVSPGVEDFHHLSHAGRWNGTAFVNDGFTSGLIDRADPADGTGSEVADNGFNPNLGSYGRTAEASKSPLAPTGAAIAGVFTSSISVSYTPGGSDRYAVAATTAPNFAGTQISSESANGAATQLAPQGLAPNTTYYLGAGAIWGEYYVFGAQIATATLANPPAAALPDFSAVDIDSVTITWLPNGNLVDITTYSVVLTTGASYPNSFAGNQTVSTVPAGAATFATLIGLAQNTTYYAFAATLNWNRVPSAYAALGSTSTLADAPATAATTFTAVGFSSFTASWSANGNPLSITTYTVQLSTAPDFNAFASSVTFSTVPVSGPTYTFTGLNANELYYFRARAVNHDGVPSNYTFLGSTLTKPVTLQAPVIAGFVEVNTSSITATWGLTALATGYTLVASLTNDPLAAFGATFPVGINTTTAGVTAPPLSPNTTYFMFVRATGPGAASAFSAYPATATLAAVPLTAVSTYTAVHVTSMTVAWLPNGNPVGVTSYTVVLSTGAAYPNAFAGNRVLSTAPAGAAPTASVGSLEDNTTYYLFVSAFNHNGVGSLVTALGSTITAISPPATVYFDEISSTTIVASAYAPTPLFSNLNLGQSGTRISINTAYAPFHGEQWVSTTSMSTARREAAAAGFNGKIYVFGGFNGVALSSAEMYDPANAAWVALPAMTARRAAVAALAGGRIYVAGGTTNGFTSLGVNEEFDPMTNTWGGAKAAMITARDRLSAVTAGGAIYAFGGETDAANTNVNEMYDPAANTWTSKAAYPAGRRQIAAAVAAGPTAHTIVAAGGSGSVASAYEYDSLLNSWTAVTSMPGGLSAGGSASLGGKVYVIGGSPALQSVYEFDPAVDLWTTRAGMITGRAELSVVSAGGRIYAVGGTSDGGATPLAVSEMYDPGVATKFTGLTPNTPAGFQAQARNQVGALSQETATVSTWTWAALPAANASPFTFVERDSITVSWASNGNPAATEFKARASTSSVFAAGAAVSSSDWGVFNSTSALSLTPNTTYFLQSKARNGVGGVPGIETAWVALGSTATLAAVPAIAPVAFGALGANAMSVSWLPNGNPLAITTYTVVLSTEAVYPNANTGNVVVASTFPAGASPTASLTGLIANTTYFAFASAVNHNGLRTAYAALGSTATLALTPGAAVPAFTAVTQSALTVQWTANGNPLAVTTYTVVMTTSAVYPNTNAGNQGFNTTAFNGTVSAGLTANTTYFAFVAAVNWTGAASSYLSLGSTATLAAAPATVASTFSAVNVSSLSVTWSASGNPLAITTYTVQLSTAPDFNAFATSFAFSTAPAAGPSATFTGLADFTTYFFRVSAVNHNSVATLYTNLGSTMTIIAPLDAPTAPVFASVDVTSITATWGLTPGATGYTFVASLLPANPPTIVAASSTTFSINATTAAAFAPALASNTTYFLFVRANGLLRSSPYAALGSTSTLTFPPATAITTFTGVGITSFTVSWEANGNALAITTYTVQLSTAPDFNAFATSVTYTTAPVNGPSAMLTGLTGNTSYYLRIRSLNHNGVPSAFVNLGSTLTVASPLFPTILDSQGGDAQWRRANGTTYQVAFLDTSGSHLDKFQVKASTTAGGLGTDLIAFTDVVVGLSPLDDYNTPWALPNSVFNALLEGVTNYITVKVFNGPPLNNFTVLQDVFYVQKDTTSPVMVNAQAGDAVVRSVAGTTYNVGVRDPSSGLAAFQYSASLNPGTANAAIIPWTDVAVVANATGYNTPWPVNFPLLVSGVTNYISVRSWDVAGATTTLADAFFVLKDTTGPSVAIASPQNGGFHSALVTLSGTAASPVGVQGTEVTILDVLSGLYWNPGSAAFNSVAVVTMSATGTTAWTLSPGIAWVDGATYRAVARSSTTAGLYSTTYATSTFVMDLSKPAVGVLAPVPDSTVSVLPAISGTAADPAPNPSGVSSVEVRLRRNTDGFWWNWFTQAWSVTAVSSVTAGTTNWSLSPTPELKGNLASGTSYFIAVRASDNALPANQGDFFVSGATFTWQDTTPPSAIANLAAAHGTAPGSINLSWTATGDDGGAGVIAQGEYRVFYSTDIAAVPSTTTALVVISTAGVSPGALQFHTLAGLTPGVTYFVALALADGDYNWSLFSNQATTTAAPSPLNAITGHVVDIATQGITAVQIDCWNAAEALVGTTFTLADGSGTFSVNNLPAGNYKLRVTYTVNGFSSAVWQDGIAMGSTNVDFVLEINYALATLTGTLGTLTTSSFGGGGLNAAAAVDAFIELHQGGRQVARAAVQPGGRWTISGLLPGSYTVRAHTAAGYTPFQDVQLVEGEVRVLGFVFDPLPTASVFAFPNPARASTTIRFESALAPLQANIHVFDISGNLVKEFTDSQISRAAAPVYRVDWDLKNQSGQPVAPGVYHVMVKIRGGTDDQSAKVIKKLAVVR